MMQLVQAAQGIKAPTGVDRMSMSTRRPESQAERAHAFGARIRSLRRSQKLTQRQVAERIPMSPGNLSRLENGELGPPGDEVIAQLADLLDADAAELFKLAGRDVGGASFERQVLGELQGLRRDMRAGFAKLDAAVAALQAAQQK
jgi:transcriptional regulator with XRE-family HTH domain